VPGDDERERFRQTFDQAVEIYDRVRTGRYDGTGERYCT
jgi:hypothetical protein